MHSTLLRQKKQDLGKALEEKTKQLIRYEKDLTQAQKSDAIAALAGGVAHQINNALTGLIGNIDLISMSANKDSDVLMYRLTSIAYAPSSRECQNWQRNPR